MDESKANTLTLIPHSLFLRKQTYLGGLSGDLDFPDL